MLYLSPRSLRSFLQPREEFLSEAIRKENKFFTPSKFDKDWDKDIRTQFDILLERLGPRKDEYNTFIHFAHLVDSTCNFIQYGKMDVGLKGADLYCPEKVTFNEYQRVDNLASKLDEIRNNSEADLRCLHDKACYESLYALAVNSIINLWVTVWDVSGYETDFDDHRNVVFHKKTEFARSYVSTRREEPVQHEVSPGETGGFRTEQVTIDQRIIELEEGG